MEKKTFELMYKIEKEHWWFHARRDLILSLLPDDKTISILDLGAGTGLLAEEIFKRGYGISAIDESVEAVKFCAERGLKNIQIARAESLPFPDQSFDLVLALDVLEHIKDDSAAVKEINRVLKPGGRAIVTVPALSILWSKQDEMLGHFRRHTAKTLRNLFSGWKIERLTYFNFFLFFPIFLMRRITGLLKVEDELQVGNYLANKLFYFIFSLEIKLLKYINFPFGVSVLGIFIK